MSESAKNDDPLQNGLDKGTGDPGDDRDFLMDQPPAKVESQDDSDGDDPRSLPVDDE